MKYFQTPPVFLFTLIFAIVEIGFIGKNDTLHLNIPYVFAYLYSSLKGEIFNH